MTGLGDRIRERRKDLRLSLTELATRANMSKTYLWEIEHGKAINPGGEILARLSRVLGVSIDLLMSGNEFTEGAQEISVPGELALMADTLGLPFNNVCSLVKVAKAIEQTSSQFHLKPVHWDWRKLYEGIKEFL